MVNFLERIFWKFDQRYKHLKVACASGAIFEKNIYMKDYQYFLYKQLIAFKV